MSERQLTPAELADIRQKCWRSPVEYCRIFHPDWFPSKMPWVHRGLCALRTGQTDFLLDFGKEWWPEDYQEGVPSEWTTDDLVKLVTNFVVTLSPAKYKDGELIEKEVVAPIFELVYDDDGHIHNIAIIRPGDNAFILPRGYSKTTLLNALNERDLAYANEKFILFISETITHAGNQVSTVRRQFEDNTLLRAVFGDQVPARNESEKWTDTEIELLNGCRLVAAGSGQQIRGTAKDATRPTRIVVDDFQDAEQCRNSETQRRKDLLWFVQVLMPARQLFGAKTTKMDVIGTMPHPEAVIAVLMDDPDWVPVRFGALDRQDDPLWEYAIDKEKLEKLRASYERKGTLDAFDYEYMSKVPLNDGVALPIEKVVYAIHPSEWYVAKCIVCDPAISDNPKADFFALAAMGMSKYGDVDVINMFTEVGVEFGDQADKFFEFHFAHMLDLPPEQVVHGVEAIAYQRSLMSLISMMQHEKSKTWGARAFFEITPIFHARHEGSKKMRVQGLLGPRLKAGKITMARPFGTLIGQMRDWGTPGAKKDAPDCVAMGIKLLDPYVSTISEANDNDSETAETIRSKLFGGRNWRKAP